MTCDRQPSYVKQTLESLFTADRSIFDGEHPATVSVVVDGTDADYLGAWKNDTRLVVELLDKRGSAALKRANKARRIAETCYRALRTAPDGADFVLLQDDAWLARGWAGFLRDAVAEADTRRNNVSMRYAIALYAAMKTPVQRPLARYNPRCFYGNVGLYLPAALFPRVVDHFAEHRGCGEMDDMIMKRFFIDFVHDLYVLVPNVVQHIGDVSSHGGVQRRSESFCGSLPARPVSQPRKPPSMRRAATAPAKPATSRPRPRHKLPPPLPPESWESTVPGASIDDALQNALQRLRWLKPTVAHHLYARKVTAVVSHGDHFLRYVSRPNQGGFVLSQSSWPGDAPAEIGPALTGHGAQGSESVRLRVEVAAAT